MGRFQFCFHFFRIDPTDASLWLLETLLEGFLIGLGSGKSDGQLTPKKISKRIKRGLEMTTCHWLIRVLPT